MHHRWSHVSGTNPVTVPSLLSVRGRIKKTRPVLRIAEDVNVFCYTSNESPLNVTRTFLDDAYVDSLTFWYLKTTFSFSFKNLTFIKEPHFVYGVYTFTLVRIFI